MTVEVAPYPFPRTSCACPQCVEPCTRQPGPLAPGDFERIAAHLGLAPEAARAHFWASPGAVVRDGVDGHIYRVGTITPRLEGGRCVFLDADDHCRIHAVAPAGCALFDMHMPAARAATRSMWLVRLQRDNCAYQALRATLPAAASWRPIR